MNTPSRVLLGRTEVPDALIKDLLDELDEPMGFTYWLDKKVLDLNKGPQISFNDLKKGYLQKLRACMHAYWQALIKDNVFKNFELESLSATRQTYTTQTNRDNRIAEELGVTRSTDIASLGLDQREYKNISYFHRDQITKSHACAFWAHGGIADLWGLNSTVPKVLTNLELNRFATNRWLNKPEERVIVPQDHAAYIQWDSLHRRGPVLMDGTRFTVSAICRLGTRS